MVSFTSTEDQQLLISTINRYAVNDVRKVAHEADEASTPASDVVDTGWQIGLVPSAIPEELGGLGEMSALTGVLAAEELAFGDLSVALHVMTPALLAYPVALYGTAEQRETLLPLCLEAEVAPVTAALLEPGIFFDPYELKTTASQHEGKIHLNGEKAYVPLAEDARWILVYAHDSETSKVEAFIVDKSMSGVEIEKREQLMGLRALPTYRLRFNDVALDASAKLGGSVGIDYEKLLNRQRVALAAMAVGVARASFEYARDYAKQRVQFGKPIAQNQAIAFMLAEMAIEIDSTRLMAWEAAYKLDKGEDATKEAYLAKQYADNMVLKVTDSGVQILGGYGFIREYPVERWLRNGRGFPTFHGLAIV
ncbi:MAG: acyl-CoA dehydrogenase family protein [Chloroflexi bacterium]|nr:acyl-CoA dehydrogenase family protein [Chloroflexota bacterium]MCC6896586.1 acyl-CoA dehydrogenase family protein [Anaerolineae bacterium]